MRILEARVEHARYERDFGQIEALVAFLVKESGRPVPHTIRIRTSEPVHGALPLRQRLIASAKGLLIARHMGHSLPRASGPQIGLAPAA